MFMDLQHIYSLFFAESLMTTLTLNTCVYNIKLQPAAA